MRNATAKMRHLTLLALALAACGGSLGGEGSLEVLIEAEDVIVAGLDPGDGPADIRDGWQLRFDAYLVTVGAIDLHQSDDPALAAAAADVYVIDLTQVPSSGATLWQLDALAEGRWELHYETAGAGDGALRHDSVDADDFARMQDEDWTYLLRGALRKDDGASCPPASLASPPATAAQVGENAAGDPCYENPVITLELGAAAETRYGPCEVDGVPGVSVTAGATQTVAITIHGDHLLFNGFPEGGEGGTLRLAQWLADCDLDVDGAVTLAELAAIAPSELVELDERFQLGGSPITPLTTMEDYVRAQLKTQGHFQGEGECPADGVGHDHG